MSKLHVYTAEELERQQKYEENARRELSQPSYHLGNDETFEQQEAYEKYLDAQDSTHNGMTMAYIAGLVRFVSSKIQEIKDIRENTKLSEKEKEQKIHRNLEKIKKNRAVIEEWFNLHIANGYRSKAFDKLYRKYNRSK